MAWSVSINKKFSVGPLRCHVLSCTADAATQAVVTGLKVIEHFSVGAQSLSTGAPKVFSNKDASGAAANGTLGCSGFTSGDVFYISVFGR